MTPALLIPGLKYRRADLYDLLGVPDDKRGGDWNTGYTRFKGAFYVFAAIGVPGRTGHDYGNYWEDNQTRLVWEAKARFTVAQPQIQALVSGQSPVHIFTRTGEREAFTYQGLASAESVRATQPVSVTWVFPGSSLPALCPPPEALKQADPATETEYLRAQRLGQGKFRSDLMKRWTGQCALTRVAMPEILRASHIKAWRDSSGLERTDPENGLLLAIHIDGLFDLGFVSFTAGGNLIIGGAVPGQVRSAFGLDPGAAISGLSDKNRSFLALHRAKHAARLAL